MKVRAVSRERRKESFLQERKESLLTVSKQKTATPFIEYITIDVHEKESDKKR